MAVNTRTPNDLRVYSQTHIENQGFDRALQLPMRESLGFDGQNAQRQNADNLSVKITSSGSITYIALAAPGTAQSDPLWQCKKIDETTGTVITFADGNSNWDNVATDLASLTYS